MIRQYFYGLLIILAAAFAVAAQVQSQEVSEEDGVPVLIKNLPDWETVRDRATLVRNETDLQKVPAARPIADLVDFSAGTEAVAAPYEAGNLLLIEYNTPQFSIDADEKFKSRLAENGGNATFYRRIGNYNVFVFDAKDETAANALLDQIKYGKFVQWLGDDPFIYEKQQRNYARTLADVFVSTVLAIIAGIGFSVLLGIGVGWLVFNYRRRRRETWEKFSDAGGMMRLNLDDLQETPSAKLYLKE